MKIVAPLLRFLPPDIPCRVLFLRRDLDEVVASQHRMIARRGKPATALSDEQLKAALQRQVDAALAWCRAAGHVALLEVDHRDLCLAPRPAMGRIDRFLGGGLDVDAMAKTPDASLYRQRAAG